MAFMHAPCRGMHLAPDLGHAASRTIYSRQSACCAGVSVLAQLRELPPLYGARRGGALPEQRLPPISLEAARTDGSERRVRRRPDAGRAEPRDWLELL